MINAPSGQKQQPFPFDNFQGIDTSRDRASLDTGQNQHLMKCDNAFCNFRGVILRDRGLSQRPGAPGDRPIRHITFYGNNLLVWAQDDDGGITLNSEPNNIKLDLAYPKNSPITSSIFKNNVVFCTSEHKMISFNGLAYKTIETKNDERPAFAITIQRRQCIAGQSTRRGIVDISRLDDNSIYSRDETQNETAVTRAGDLDISSLIGTNDDITGLGVFETNQLAIFTNDQTLVYTISTDISKWAINDKANINIGAISHNTICRVNTDLMFCSRFGIHSLRRSDNNGITIYSVPMSSKVEELYRALIKSVPNKKNISAFYDQDLMQYNVFFPQLNGSSRRLTMTVNQSSGGENKWSTGSHLDYKCGASFNGDTVYGTNGGIFNAVNHEYDADLLPTMIIETPILWCGSLTEPKIGAELIFQASGNATITIEVFNEEDKKISEIKFQVSAKNKDPSKGDDLHYVIPLLQQYNRQLVQQFKGLWLRITASDGTNERLKILGFALVLNKK